MMDPEDPEEIAHVATNSARDSEPEDAETSAGGDLRPTLVKQTREEEILIEVSRLASSVRTMQRTEYSKYEKRLIQQRIEQYIKNIAYAFTNFCVDEFNLYNHSVGLHTSRSVAKKKLGEFIKSKPDFIEFFDMAVARAEKKLPRMKLRTFIGYGIIPVFGWMSLCHTLPFIDEKTSQTWTLVHNVRKLKKSKGSLPYEEIRDKICVIYL